MWKVRNRSKEVILSTACERDSYQMSGDILNITPYPEPDVQCNVTRCESFTPDQRNGAKYFHIAIRRRHSFYRSVIYLDLIPGPLLVLFTCTSFSEAESIAAELLATVEITFQMGRNSYYFEVSFKCKCMKTKKLLFSLTSI